MAKLKIKGFPGRKFSRYVLAHKNARVPRKINMFQFGEDGTVVIETNDFYDFEIKRIKRAYSYDGKIKDDSLDKKGKKKPDKKGKKKPDKKGKKSKED